jgi:anti-sigma factor RsiW
MTTVTREPSCREVTEFLADYVAGTLGPHERWVFERHLAECPECVVYLRSYAETIRLAKDAYDVDEVPAVPNELVRAILDARIVRRS